MNEYEAKIEARRERLVARAERLNAAASAMFRKSDLREEVSGIPFGQPILVGHHSEGKHRRAIARANRAANRALEMHKAADQAAARAEAVGSGGISSDDPDAVAKLREKLAGLEVRLDQEKRWNRQIAKGGAAAIEGVDEKAKAAIADMIARWPYMARGYFHVANRSAEIRRVKARIEALGKASERKHVEIEGPHGARVIQNVEANRIQIVFPGKPDAAVRADLKARGFRWEPSENAWQRHLNNAGVYAAKGFLKGE